MKIKLTNMLLVIMLILTSCTSKQKIEPEDEFAVDSGIGTQSPVVSKDNIEDELSLDENTTSNKTTSVGTEKSLEDELAGLSDDTQSKTVESDSLSNEPTSNPHNNKQATKDKPRAESASDQAILEDEATSEESVSSNINPVVVEESSAGNVSKPSSEPAKISNVIYQSNENGGAVVISANKPLEYTTRVNSSTNQFVLEIQNSTIPESLKRALNTKDMMSSIGSVDIYQKPNVTRFVVQLRPDSQEPIIQQEGNSILIIGSSLRPAVVKNQTNAVTDLNMAGSIESTKEQHSEKSNMDGKLKPHSEIVDLYTDGIMTSDDLEEFLISNNKFYGKKISIETNKMDLVDVFKFLAEESGVNMIVDSAVAGAITMKLRDVPWDQAFVLVLKKEKLGFKRQGNVLRIGKIEDFSREEGNAIVLRQTRRVQAPLIIRRFFIGYAKLKDLEDKINAFLSQNEQAALSQIASSPNVPKVTVNDPNASSSPAADSGQAAPAKNFTKINGRVIADQRTNSLIITETEENMEKVSKLIQALDTQPQQVLIEGKVVEAKESYSRGMGVSWSSTPSEVTTLNRVGIGINPILDAGSVVLNSNISWGQLDLLGRLDAQLQIGEREDKVRILSSPRVTVLTNEQANITQTASILIPESVTQNGVTTVTSRNVDFGVNLSVTPTVSNEGTVLLDLDLKREFLARVDSLSPERRSAKTKLIVKSGQTAVVGGIFESETRNGSSGVPGLKDIPILGSLFRSEAEGRSKNELVIFVTPTILKPVVGTQKIVTEIK